MFTRWYETGFPLHFFGFHNIIPASRTLRMQLHRSPLPSSRDASVSLSGSLQVGSSNLGCKNNVKWRTVQKNATNKKSCPYCNIFDAVWSSFSETCAPQLHTDLLTAPKAAKRHRGPNTAIACGTTPSPWCFDHPYETRAIQVRNKNRSHRDIV